MCPDTHTQTTQILTLSTMWLSKNYVADGEDGGSEQNDYVRLHWEVGGKEGWGREKRLRSLVKLL